MPESIDPAGESPPSRSERPIPDPLGKGELDLTEEELTELDGSSAEPDTVVGQADATSESLTSLFKDKDPAHYKDGFAGSGDEERPGDPSRSQNDGDLPEEKQPEG